MAIVVPQRRQKEGTLDKIAKALDIVQSTLGISLAIPKYISDVKQAKELQKMRELSAQSTADYRESLQKKGERDYNLAVFKEARPAQKSVVGGGYEGGGQAEFGGGGEAKPIEESQQIQYEPGTEILNGQSVVKRASSSPSKYADMVIKIKEGKDKNRYFAYRTNPKDDTIQMLPSMVDKSKIDADSNLFAIDDAPEYYNVADKSTRDAMAKANRDTDTQKTDIGYAEKLDEIITEATKKYRNDVDYGDTVLAGLERNDPTGDGIASNAMVKMFDTGPITPADRAVVVPPQLSQYFEKGKNFLLSLNDKVLSDGTRRTMRNLVKRLQTIADLKMAVSTLDQVKLKQGTYGPNFGKGHIQYLKDKYSQPIPTQPGKPPMTIFDGIVMLSKNPRNDVLRERLKNLLDPVE